MSKKQINLRDFYENPQCKEFIDKLFSEFSYIDNVENWDNTWFSHVAKEIGGKLIKVTYESCRYTADVIVEVDEEEFTLFLLGLE